MIIVKDLKNVFVVLEAIQFALKLGQEILTPEGKNPFVIAIEACELDNDLHSQLEKENTQVYFKAEKILKDYFNLDQNGAAAEENGIENGGNDTEYMAANAEMSDM